jgi:3-deoxy-D-manno-octulosonate 8-phosphate phosphatase (KDO 8-P phosphatase)
MNNSLPKFLIFDVDGVMTTGQFLYSGKGKIFKVFGAHDNDGIKLLKGKISIVFLTADKRGFEITRKRIVEDMDQVLYLVGESERLDFIETKFGLRKSIYMGDGIHDVEILKQCLFGITPHNAREEAKEVADYITPSNSAEGAVLDACLKIDQLFFQK